MGTRSAIAVENQDGTCDYVYCHWDGYPSHNGRILRDHYQDRDKVRSLISNGSISTLGSEVGEKHNFDAMINPNWTKFYHRDREEEWEDCKPMSSSKDEIKYGDYVYIYTLGEEWICFACSSGSSRSLSIDDAIVKYG